MGWLNRMTQFKAKSENKQNVGAGLLTYPTLMAADILLYDTQKVPVGEDQKQHLEITRDIANRFNSLFGKTFVLPEPVIGVTGRRIMGLDDPTKKMSKSTAVTNPMHAIGIVDEPACIHKAIMRAKTDMGPVVNYDEATPGVRNLLNIYQSVTGKSDEETKQIFDGIGYGSMKQQISEAVLEHLRPIRERYLYLLEHKDYLRDVVYQGAE